MTFYLTCSQIHTRPWGLVVGAVQNVMFPVVAVQRSAAYLIAITLAVLDVCVASEVQ